MSNNSPRDTVDDTFDALCRTPVGEMRELMKTARLQTTNDLQSFLDKHHWTLYDFVNKSKAHLSIRWADDE